MYMLPYVMSTSLILNEMNIHKLILYRNNYVTMEKNYTWIIKWNDNQLKQHRSEMDNDQNS